MWWVFIKNNCFALILLSLVSCQKSRSEILKLYLSSSLLPLAKDIQIFTKDRPLDLNFLSSSAIVRQIKAGAPCDIAILADNRWHNQLIDSGLIEKKVHIIAKNKLVLVSAKKREDACDLSHALKKIAPSDKLIVGDPDFVPLGIYTKKALDKLKVFTKLSKQMLKAHSARHATMLLKQGAGSYAILYQSDALNDNIHVISQIDSKLHPTIVYPLVICKNSQNNSDVLKWFLSDAFLQILKKRFFKGIKSF